LLGLKVRVGWDEVVGEKVGADVAVGAEVTVGDEVGGGVVGGGDDNDGFGVDPLSSSQMGVHVESGLQNAIPLPQSPATLRQNPSTSHGTPEHGPSFASLVGEGVGDNGFVASPPSPPSSLGINIPAAHPKSSSPGSNEAQIVVPVSGWTLLSTSSSTPDHTELKT